MNTILIVVLIYLILCLISFYTIKSFINLVRNIGLVDESEEDTKKLFVIIYGGNKLFVLLSPIIIILITISVITELFINKGA